MTRTWQICLAVLSWLIAVPANAQMQEIRDGKWSGVDPSRAYILYHVPAGKNVLPAQPIFLKMASSAPTTAQEPLFAARNGHSFVKNAQARVYLLELPAGDYLIYGLSLPGAKPMLATCFCLGTVSFSARAGTVTDLGAILVGSARAPSPFPELASETNLGPSIDTGFYHPVAGVRRTATQSLIKAWPAQAKITSAAYRAEGRFFDPRTAFVNRLAPLPGVLGYSNGRPVDLATNKTPADHFVE